MRVLILGGTGFIGPHVVRALAAHDVTLFHRGGASSSPGAVSHIHGDRAELPRFAHTFQRLRPDVVIDMMAQNGDAARLALRTLALIASRMVMISSASVYRQYGVILGTEAGPIVDGAAIEDAALRSRLFPYRREQLRALDDPLRWMDDYDKIPAETAYLEAAGPTVSIVRLPMVYGPGDPSDRLGRYVNAMQHGASEIRLHENVAGWRNARGYVVDVGKAIALVATAGEAGRIYNVADAGDLAEADWVERVGRIAGWTGRVTRVPGGYPAGIVPLEELPPNANFSQDLRLDTTRIRTELGYREGTSLDAALQATISARTYGPAPAGSDSP